MKWVNGAEALAEWLHDYGAILFGLAIGAVGYAAYEITDDDDNNKGNRPPVSP